MEEELEEVKASDLAELPEVEEPGQGEAARETLDDWSFVVNALRLNRPI